MMFLLDHEICKSLSLKRWFFRNLVEIVSLRYIINVIIDDNLKESISQI